ncbi:DUF4262 domain-containing protein [Chitinophaga flava]|uniref:DUF4262 domain-containing protein n=1 Tax=Chitinophaga flava TaxID=2259036 RepID=A0A365XRK5_9BACT|nr:DUF4262 domain-containing protein [Chitinophaga flava]RBL88215.1 DUF4262 domain-containing protein [Chitinophaga flava]
MSNDHCQHLPISKEKIQKKIDQYGCFIVQIQEDDYLPAFVYTIGLYQQYGHPEIICFGLSVEVMASLLNDACDLIKKGQSFAPGTSYDDFLDNYPVQFITVDQAYYPYYLGTGCFFYGHNRFPALQLIWPDKQSLFPWEPEFNPNWLRKQPLLDRNSDFMFQEEKNLAVFTSRQILEGSPILYIYHDEDGDWQFLNEEETKEQDVRIVALSEIAKIDPGIKELHLLSYGQRAWRASPKDKWQWE